MYKDSTNNYILLGHLKYFYKGLNQISKIEQYDLKYKLLFTTEYDFNDSGNLIESRFYNSSGLNTVTTMNYDDKVNPWYSLKDWLNSKVSFSKNNLLNSKTAYINNNQKNSETIFTYTYDPDGYPLSCEIHSITNNVKTITNEKYEYR